MKYLIASLCLVSTAQAADYKLFYLAGGKTLSTYEALSQAMRGAEVFKCQAVETKVSKSGTSIGLKNVKKPKAE